MWYESYQRPRRRTWAELWWRAAFILLVAALAAGATALWWHRYTGTPEYSLSQLGKAVKAKNYGEAAKYVDEERISGEIAESLTDVVVEKYTKKFDRRSIPIHREPDRAITKDGAALRWLGADWRRGMPFVCC